ncbi:MAG TPA: hypothetical protein VIH42_05685 [Thermoguttaceae bacterium]
MIHEEAAHTLRKLITDSGGYREHHVALDFILDELRASRQDNARLILERNELVKQRSELIATLGTTPQFRRVVSEKLRSRQKDADER